MAFVSADRVQETSTTTGTGTYDLAGAVTGFQTFVAGIGTTNTCYYTATMGADWEVGIGTVTDATPDTLARTTILQSSNADAAVSWGAGSKTIFCTAPALVLGMLPANGQIQFPATQNASSGVNVLDDYEEGTWTPTLTFGGAAVGLTYSVNEGYYVKIGRVVYVECYFTLTNNGSSTGTAVVNGFPFACANNSARGALVFGQYSNLASIVGGPLASMNANATTATLINGHASSSPVMTQANITDTADFFLSGWYKTTT